MLRTLLLSLFLLGSLPQDKTPRKLEWKLAPGHAAEYLYLDRAGKPIPDQKLLLFASELTPTANRLAIDTYEQLPLAFIFQLPPEPIKGGVGWEYTSYHFNDAYDALGGFDYLGAGSLRPLFAKGRYIAKFQKKGDEDLALIDGAFSLVEIRRDMVNNQMKVIVTKNELGTLATSVQFNMSKGLVQKAAWQYKIKAQDREGGRIVDKRSETHQMIELKEDAELDAAKVQPAVETSMARAVEWLRKQQKNGVWNTAKPGPGAALEGVAQTSVVVRALIAAGVKPDDPAIAAASRTLRSAPPPETFVLCQQIFALAAKSPTKEEADDLKRFSEELLKRRDPRTGGWPSLAGRNNEVASSFLTGYALEALTLSPDARIPDETLRRGLEFFSGSWIEDDGKVDLDLETEKDATTVVPDPKKDKDLVPATWPALVGVQQATDLRAGRKGSFFSVVAALRALLLLPERLKMDEKQVKNLELPIKKGLANLQLRWTLRSVPPIEAFWCTQRMEYLGLLGPTLARAKIDRIGGSDWRVEGAMLLLREQGEDGSWFSGTDQAVVKTAHALIFLASAKR
ncbi:MAG: hypothetical protein JO332_04155 [Planctomycetaceae bacterium]|nr:hypothetical protein [Planctomycetaceae bacterium]